MGTYHTYMGILQSIQEENLGQQHKPAKDIQYRGVHNKPVISLPPDQSGQSTVDLEYKLSF